jgi:hypothetical protein
MRRASPRHWRCLTELRNCSERSRDQTPVVDHGTRFLCPAGACQTDNRPVRSGSYDRVAGDDDDRQPDPPSFSPVVRRGLNAPEGMRVDDGDRIPRDWPRIRSRESSARLPPEKTKVSVIALQEKAPLLLFDRAEAGERKKDAVDVQSVIGSEERGGRESERCEHGQQRRPDPARSRGSNLRNA